LPAGVKPHQQYYAKKIHRAKVARLPSDSINLYSKLKKLAPVQTTTETAHRFQIVSEISVPTSVSQIAFKNVSDKYAR